MTTSTLLMQGQALALSNTMRMPLVLILSKRRMRFLLGHSRIPLRHLHILVTEHLADGLHRHTCLQRNEASERVPSRMVGIEVSPFSFPQAHRKPFGWKATTARWPCWSPLLPCSCPPLAALELYVNKTTIAAIDFLILRSFQRKGLCNSGLKAKSTTFECC